MVVSYHHLFVFLIIFYLYKFLRMGPKLKDIDKRMSPGPANYNIPSKMVEKVGKSMGERLPGTIGQPTIAPGPGAYAQEKSKKDDISFSMGAKL